MACAADGSSGDDGSEDDGSSGPPVAVCGDGIADGFEVCDGFDLAGTTCVTLGYTGGALSCAADCSDYDTTACTTTNGTCCTAHGGLGCEVQTIESCVCGFDPFCCDTQWDDQCVGEAVEYCSASCS